jgi:hypothetical protein
MKINSKTWKETLRTKTTWVGILTILIGSSKVLAGVLKGVFDGNWNEAMPIIQDGVGVFSTLTPLGFLAIFARHGMVKLHMAVDENTAISRDAKANARSAYVQAKSLQDKKKPKRT